MDSVLPRIRAIENASGAAGTIAAQKLVNSPADGYTFLVGSSNELSATGAVNKVQKYDPRRDMTSIGVIASRYGSLGYPISSEYPHLDVKLWRYWLSLLPGFAASSSALARASASRPLIRSQ